MTSHLPSPSPADLLSGGRVVVTGGGPLAGGLVVGLARCGAEIVSLGGEAASTAAAAGGLVPCAFDSASSVAGAVDAAADALGGIDLFVHTWVHPLALGRQPIDGMGEDHWIAACESSLDAALWVAQAVHRHLVVGGPPGRGGAFVAVVSTLGMAGGVGYAPLAATGEGIRALVKSMARQWGVDGVTVHTIATSPKQWIPGDEGDVLANSVSLSVPALGPADAADDLAPVIALLATSAAHYATGSTLTLDGGVWTAL